MTPTTIDTAVREFRKTRQVTPDPEYAVHVKTYNYLLGSSFAFAATDLPDDHHIYEVTHVNGQDYVMVHSYTFDPDSETKVTMGKD